MSFVLPRLHCIFNATAARSTCAPLPSSRALCPWRPTSQRIFLPAHHSVSRPFASSALLLDAMSDKKQQPDQKKTYHTKATGKALETVKKHSAENDLKLFGSCFWYVTLQLTALISSGCANQQRTHAVLTCYPRKQSFCPACVDLIGIQRHSLSIH